LKKRRATKAGLAIFPSASQNFLAAIPESLSKSGQHFD
jgi:hypothetical protein